MRGLKTQEGNKFNKFWDIVSSQALKNNKIFFLECGEGREFETEGMEGEDLRGWLIPIDKADEFEKEWLKDNVSDKWLDFIIWAEWRNKNGHISVEFVSY